MKVKVIFGLALSTLVALLPFVMVWAMIFLERFSYTGLWDNEMLWVLIVCATLLSIAILGWMSLAFLRIAEINLETKKAEEEKDRERKRFDAMKTARPLGTGEMLEMMITACDKVHKLDVEEGDRAAKQLNEVIELLKTQLAVEFKVKDKT